MEKETHPTGEKDSSVKPPLSQSDTRADARADAILACEDKTTAAPDSAAAQPESQPGRSESAVAAQSGPDYAGNDISLREVDPVDVCVRNLAVSVDTSPSKAIALFSSRKQHQPGSDGAASHLKTILDHVSADFPCGSLTGIFGGSGSGKSTMLNIMSNRMHGRRLAVSGTTTFNGHQDPTSVRTAYVMQQDVLIPSLTVRETLRYAADLRLPASINKEERHRVVEEVILELGLKEAADTRIGNSTHKGCSGGEKRRCSIGVQMLANPSVLFLDEPTTGLDATSSFQLIRTLKNLAKKGRTIITTIHQPRSEIWSLFDNVVLLSRGASAYSGPAGQCLPFFADLGYELPPFVNPAEHVIDCVAVDTRSPELEQVSSERAQRITQAWRTESEKKFIEEKSSQVTVSAKKQGRRSKIVDPNHSLLREIWVLTRRTWFVTIRDPMGMLGSLVEAIGMAVITGWIFLQLDGSQSGIRSREGALYIAAAMQGYLVLLYETYRLSNDIQLFDRERGEGVVSVPGFLISRRLARVLVEDVPVPLIFSIIYYFMAGFRIDDNTFLTFFSVILIQQYIAVSFAMLCISVSRSFAGASLVGNLAYTLQSMACGFFLQVHNMPVYVRWTKWIAYVYYAFGALCANEFVGQFYDCPEPGGRDNPACKPYLGEYVMESLGFPVDWVWKPILALVGFAIAFYLGAAFLLVFWKTELSISRARTTDTDNSAGKEKMKQRSIEDVRTITMRLESYALNIQKRKWWGGKLKKLEILKPVTTQFEPGVLNVVMGPSGSGKTSLLNSLARRLTDDFTTKYHASGKMLFNGASPSEDVIQSICSYVTQDDDALLSSLTVRETLRFAAGLRLPSWMSKEEKYERAESVLLKMGLKDCADNLIGNELIKGISGGEKRRVTIAVQILTDPRVLLLDEPTSGLDAFTASSIIDVLRGLAEEGRTLILTIHQSRSDLFAHFGNVLLLARGGYPVYAGSGAGMLPHFAAQGHECPKTTNPADFALDLITVDLQHETQEAATREKVRSLILSWNGDNVPLQTQTTIATPAELGSLRRSMASFSTAFPILVHRAMINFWRQPPLMIARIMQVLGLAIVLALYFAPLKNDYYSVQTRLGFIQETAPIYFVGMLQNVAVYPFEKDVFYREHNDRAYSVEAFFLQYTILEIPFEIITSLLFSVLADLAVGLPRTAVMFFIIAYNCFCIVSCGESFGILFNTLFDHTGFAINITSVFLSIAQVMGGVLSLNMPSFLQAFNHLSPVKYSVASIAPYAMRGQKFTCNDSQRLASGRCPIETGEEALKLYNLDVDPKINLLALGVCAIVYRLLAYLLLKARREKWTVKFWKKE